jgi:hypothetical protein
MVLPSKDFSSPPLLTSFDLFSFETGAIALLIVIASKFFFQFFR